MNLETFIVVVMLAMVVNAVLMLAGIGVLFLTMKLYTEYKKDRMIDARAGGGGKPGAEALLRLLAAGGKARAKTSGEPAEGAGVAPCDEVRRRP